MSNVSIGFTKFDTLELRSEEIIISNKQYTDMTDLSSTILIHQAKSEATTILTDQANETCQVFSADGVCDKLGVDKQFLGELVDVARSEIPTIIDQANADLEELSAVLKTATECGERYLESLHRLHDNTETLSLDEIEKLLPQARSLVVPVAIMRDQWERSRQTIISELHRGFLRFDAEATQEGYPPRQRSECEGGHSQGLPATTDD